jgi:hypothetical protein
MRLESLLQCLYDGLGSFRNLTGDFQGDANGCLMSMCYLAARGRAKEHSNSLGASHELTGIHFQSGILELVTRVACQCHQASIIRGRHNRPSNMNDPMREHKAL